MCASTMKAIEREFFPRSTRDLILRHFSVDAASTCRPRTSDRRSIDNDCEQPNGTTVARRTCCPESTETATPKTAAASGATSSGSPPGPSGDGRSRRRSPFPASCGRAKDRASAGRPRGRAATDTKGASGSPTTAACELARCRFGNARRRLRRRYPAARPALAKASQVRWK